MSQWGKDTINIILSDGKKRTISEILDDMWNFIDEQNKTAKKKYGRWTGRNIPTKAEITRFLRKYETGVFDIYTGSPKKRHVGATTERRWWKAD